MRRIRQTARGPRRIIASTRALLHGARLSWMGIMAPTTAAANSHVH